MTAIEFLKTKGILKTDCTKWIISWKNGKDVELVELMEEYANNKVHLPDVIPIDTEPSCQTCKNRLSNFDICSGCMRSNQNLMDNYEAQYE